MDTEVAMECFEWEDNGDGTATITNYNANCSKEVDIPSKIGNLTVTTIGDSAFKSKGITKVISYAGVTKIGYGAFQSNKLNYVKLSKSIKTIGSFAFYSAGVKELIMSEGVEEIGSYAFANNSICSVTLPVSLRKIGDYAFQNNCLTNDGLNSNPTLGAGVYSNNKFPDDSMFVYKINNDGSRDYTTIVAYAGTIKNDLVIPEWSHGYQLKTIGAGAFASSKLTGTVKIPDSVTSIGSTAFYNNSLTSIKIPPNIKVINSDTFRSNALEKVEFNEGLEKINSTAFRYNKLTEINVPDSVYYIGGGAFIQNLVNGEDGLIYARIKDPADPTKGKWDYTTIVSYAGGRVSNYSLTIPAKKLDPVTNEYVTLKNINGAAFLSCNIKTLNLPDISEVPNLTIAVNTFYHNNITNNSPYVHDGFMFKVTGGQIKYNEISDFVGPNPGANGVLRIPETAPDGTHITYLSGTYTWRTYGAVLIPQYVTHINGAIFAKSATNDPNLKKIINLTGRSSFLNGSNKKIDWTTITSSTTSGQEFETGTIKHQAGNIEVVNSE